MAHFIAVALHFLRTSLALQALGDLLGHDTHGLALLGPYARKIDEDVLARDGEVTVVSDFPAAKLWDGNGKELKSFGGLTDIATAVSRGPRKV